MNKQNSSPQLTEIINNKNTCCVQEIIDSLKKVWVFKIYDSEWKYIFNWKLEDLVNLINTGKIIQTNIWWFTDINGNNIVKFWPWNENWFTDRSIINELILKISNYLDLSASHKIEEQSKKIDKLKEIYLKIYIKNRRNLSDEAFIVSHWVYPFSDELKAFEKISWEIWQHYDAHWIDKLDMLWNLVKILSEWIDNSRTFFTAPFEIPNEIKAALWPALWTSWWTAYKWWIAVLVSGYEKSLLKDWIKYVFINDAYWELIEQLKVCFPEYSFHLLSEQKKVLENH